MDELVIEKVDSVNLRVRCERGTAKELSDFFTFKVPGHKFMPQYKNKMWDGTIKLYNIYSQLLYCGLLDYVYKFAKDRNYTVKVENTDDFAKLNLITKDTVNDYIVNRLQPISNDVLLKPHEHQNLLLP